MSDIKHRTNEQLRHDVHYNKQRANTHKLRAEAAQAEIDRRDAVPSPAQPRPRFIITPERLERMQYHITNAPNGEVREMLSDNLTRLLLEEINND